MPIAGLVRLRKNLIGKQSVIGTRVNPTEQLPWSGIIEYNPNRTQPDVSEGSLDPIQSPYPTAADVTLPATGLLDYDNLPIRLSAGVKGGVSPTGGGTAKTWEYQVASVTADAFDYYTIQSNDDTEATDTIEGFGGVIDTWEETLPEDGGPWTLSDNWVFAGGSLGANGQDGITPDTSPTYVFGTDTFITLDSAYGSIGVTPLVDALHGATLRGNNNLDRKRFHNGSNTRFQLAGYGRGERVIEAVITLAKTAATIAERATLDDSEVPDRFLRFSTDSTALAQAATPFVYERSMAARLFDARDVEIGGNACIEFTYRAFYHPTLGYAYKAKVVCQRTALP